MPSETIISCPVCNSEAVYKYGKTRSGRQRLQCLICGRQFSLGAKKQEILGKPICNECGKHMNLYKIEGEVIRFRCSDYPVCKTFRKFRIKEEV
jgi:transposase-like protein